MASVWSGKKERAIDNVRSILSDGASHSIGDVVTQVSSQSGVSGKNAMKAVYALTESGEAIVTGPYIGGSIARKVS